MKHCFPNFCCILCILLQTMSTIYSVFVESEDSSECFGRQLVQDGENTTMWLLDIPSHNSATGNIQTRFKSSHF